MRKFFAIALVIFISMTLKAQEAMISGKVEDELGEPLPGVNIVIKGTIRGVITDVAGEFTLSAPRGSILIFNFIGYKTEEVIIEDQIRINLQMTPELTSLEEVIVVGYGEQKKVNLTGAVDALKLDDVANRAITNSGQILQGKSSGVQITQNSGQPGQDDAVIRIRGVSSLDNNNAPLVIIDGVEGNMDDVHPNDIQSMTVLKDASSAAIYGNRASAGVILIETRSGEPGLSIQYSGSVSIQKASALPEVSDAGSYVELLNEARANSGYPAKFDSTQIAAYKAGGDPRFPSTSWYDKYFSTAVMHNHHVNVSGGQKDKYRFNFSAGYNDQDGVLYGTGAQKVSYSTKLISFFLNKKLNISFDLSGYQKKEQELSSSTPTVLTAAAMTSPIAFFQSVDTVSGNNLYGYGARYFALKDNGGGINRERNNMKYQVSAELTPVTGVKGKVLYSKRVYDYNYVRLVPSVPLAGNVFDGEGSISQSELQQTVLQNFWTTFFATLSLRKQFGHHDFNLLGGFERLEYQSRSTDAGIKDLLANEPVFSLGDASTRYLDGDANEMATQSYFGRFNYAYNNKYLLELNIRKDGSSRFSAGNKWGTFPSASVGWRISQEPFIQEIEFISEMKLRASWGELGNQNIGEYYASYDRLDPGESYSFGGLIVPGTGTTVLANRDVTWEVSEQRNIGLDVAFLNNRLTLTSEYFHRENRNLLLRLSLPGSLGLGAANPPYQNVGTMSNQGIEFSLGYKSHRRSFSYSINSNLAYSKSNVEDIGPLEYLSHEDVISGYSPPAGIIRSYVGEEFGSYYGYVAEGIYQVDDFTWQNNSDPEIPFYERLFSLKDGLANPGEIMANPAPGDIKFKDLKEDGVITEEDKTIIGNSQPKWLFSFNLNLNYRGFYLNALTQGVAGVDAYLMGAMIMPFWNGTGPITTDLANNRWTPENPSNTRQRLYDDAQRNNIVSSYYIEDASYVRIKNIQFGYNLPDKFLKSHQIGSAQVFASIENAFTFTSFSGFDPERNFNKITGDFHPQVQIYSLGLNVEF